MLTALLVMVSLALLLGIVLGYSALKFKVEGDPLVARIDAILPQTQCGLWLPGLQALRHGHRRRRG